MFPSDDHKTWLDREIKAQQRRHTHRRVARAVAVTLVALLVALVVTVGAMLAPAITALAVREWHTPDGPFLLIIFPAVTVAVIAAAIGE